MGISGLLPLLREAQRKGHVKEFSGQTVGVDSYIWLYKGAFSCAADLALGTPTTKYVSFFMERAHMLRHYGIEPLFVFDGGPLPSKRATELERQRNRTERRTQATKLWNQAKRKAAFELFQKCVEATPAMAKAVIEELKKHGFRYIVAPYEADAQLAFLESQGVISAAISEDSDLIVFGCSNIIFKLDKFGAASIFDRSRMHRARAVDIAGWDNRRLRQMCILSGCDYAASVAGVGLKKAYSYTLRSTDIASAVRLMRADGLDVPDGYEGDAVRADLTFLYQRVYDPHAKALAHVTSLCDDAPAIEDMPFIGDDLEPDVAHAIAMGDIDPFSYLPFGQHVGPVVAAPSNVLAESPTKKAGSRTPSSTTAASRSKSLLSFWAKPGAKASRAKGQLQLVQAKSASSATSAVANEAAQCPAVIAVEDEEDEEDEVLIVMTRSRRAAKDSNVVSTGQRSRFFGNPNTTPESSKTEPARTLEWPETPAQLHAYSIDSQETIVQPLSATQTSGFDEVVSSTATTQPLSQSSTVCTIDLTSTFLGPLQANSAAQKEDLQPEGRKRAYYLLDQAQHKPSGVSEWAAAPVYKKESLCSSTDTSPNSLASGKATMLTRARSLNQPPNRYAAGSNMNNANSPAKRSLNLASLTQIKRRISSSHSPIGTPRGSSIFHPDENNSDSRLSLGSAFTNGIDGLASLTSAKRRVVGTSWRTKRYGSAGETPSASAYIKSNSAQAPNTVLVDDIVDSSDGEKEYDTGTICA